MAIAYTNNVANSSYSYSTSGSKLYLTLTADDGYIFQSAPYVYSFDGDFYSTDYMTLSDDSKTATLTISGYSDIETIAFYGSTVAESSGGVVFDITESDNVSYSTDSTIDADNNTVYVTINLYNTVTSTYGLFNVKASYTNTSGETVTVDLDVTVSSTHNTVSATLTDVDTDNDVTITGDAVYAIYVDATDTSNIETLPDLYNATEDVTVNVIAYTGCYFADAPTVTALTLYSSTLTLNDDATEATLTIDADTATTIASRGYSLAVTANAVEQENTDVTGCINIYSVTDNILDDFATKRFYETTETSSGYIDYAVYVANIRKLYCTVNENTEQDIMCGNYNTGIVAPTVSDTIVTVKLGDVKIPQYNNNIVDYETKLTMFVPLHGLVDIPNEYVGKTLSLQYVFDIINGNGTAQILYGGNCVMMYDVDSGVDVIYRTLEVYTNIENTSATDNKAIYGLTPFVNVIYYTATDSDRQRTSGLRLMSELNGYYAFEYITNLECPMMKEEYDMIIDLLKKGVYL